MAKKKLRVAAAQCGAIPGDVTANIATVVGLIGDAAACGARFVIFPELILSGYALDRIAADPEGIAFGLDDPRLAPIGEACSAGHIWSAVSLPTREDGTLYLSLAVFSADGAMVGLYHKQHLFGPENEVFRAGSEYLRVDIDDWRLSFAVCFDLAFPEHAHEAAKGCDIYAAGVVGTGPDGYDRSYGRMTECARDNHVFTLFANQLGATGVGEAFGAAGIWAPDGTLLAEGDDRTPGVVTADLDPLLLA